MPLSVTLIRSTTTANNRMIVGGTVVASGWSNNASFYTVPLGKRLVLKMPGELRQGNPAMTVSFGSSWGSDSTVNSAIISGGVALYDLGQTIVATGVLEDDV